MNEYLAGRTPIPCTLCNNFIKFDKFLEMADSVGAPKIATGHYARVDFNAASGRYELRRAADPAKDQTFFLFGLTQPQLARTMFPLGGGSSRTCATSPAKWISPSPTKARASKSVSSPTATMRFHGRLSARKRASAGSHSRRSGDCRRREDRRHDGVHHFTVGQRKGLGVAKGEPLYVISTDPIRSA